jgi:hypothetical protein
MNSEPQRLIEGASALGIALDAAQAARLLRLLDELAHWNRSYNLTAITTRESMISAHLLDSLAAQPDLKGLRIADVGTGAGFPGLPLALIEPQRQFTLIDSVAKKIRFVTHAVRVLELANVVPLQARVETLNPDIPFSTVIARAYAALPDLQRRYPGGRAQGALSAGRIVRVAAWLAAGAGAQAYDSGARCGTAQSQLCAAAGVISMGLLPSREAGRLKALVNETSSAAA